MSQDTTQVLCRACGECAVELPGFNIGCFDGGRIQECECGCECECAGELRVVDVDDANCNIEFVPDESELYEELPAGYDPSDAEFSISAQMEVIRG